MNYVYYILLLVYSVDIINSKVTSKSLYNNKENVQTILNAYNRQDYVEMWIGLIDLKIKLDPPDMYSNEMLQLIIMRRYLERHHKYYLMVHPSRQPTNVPSKSHQVDLNDPEVENHIMNSLSVLDFLIQEGNSFIDEDAQKELLGMMPDESTLDNVELNVEQMLSTFSAVALAAVETSEAAADSSLTNSEVSHDAENSNKVPMNENSSTVKFSKETNEAISNAMNELAQVTGTATNVVTSVVATSTNTEISNSDNDAIGESLIGLINIFGSLSNAPTTSEQKN